MSQATLLWQLFWVFTRVAFFSWGGGPASMALMQRETTAIGWVNQDEFADALAFGNALPGPIAPQVSAYIGFKMAGLPGAISAASGTVIPTTALLLVLISFFFSIKNSPVIQAMLTAVRPVIVGLLLWTTYDIAKTVFNTQKLGAVTGLLQSWDKILIALVSFALLTFTKINPVFIIIGAAILGLIVYR